MSNWMSLKRSHATFEIIQVGLDEDYVGPKFHNHREILITR